MSEAIPISQKKLMRTIVKLHLTLWIRMIKNNKAVAIMSGVIVFYGLFGLIGFNVFIVYGEPEAIDVAVVVGTLMYMTSSMFFPAGENQVPPSSLALYGLSAKKITPIIMVLHIAQTRGAMAIVCTVVTTIIVCITAPSPVFIPLILVAFLASFSLTIISNAVVSLNTRAGNKNERKRTERIRVFSFVIIIVLLFAFNFFVNSASVDMLYPIFRWLAFTPLGSGAGIIVWAFRGQWLLSALCAIVTVVYLWCGYHIWAKNIAHELIAPLDQANTPGKKRPVRRRASRTRATLILPGLRVTPAGAIISRTIRYMFRDSRLKMQLFSFPIVLVCFFFYVLSGFMSKNTLCIMGPLCALTVLSYVCNVLGYDGPSTWVHVCSGVRPRIVLASRIAGIILLYIPFFVLVVVTSLFFVTSKYIPLLITASVGAMIVAFGAGAFLSVFLPFPMSRPGTNPFQDRSGYSSAALLATVSNLLTLFFTFLPSIIMGVIGVKTDNNLLLWLACLVALVLPSIVSFVAWRIAAARIDTAYVDIFEKVKRYV